LKVIARDAITKAFQLGADYESTSMLDMAQRKEILRKLNELQTKIDTVN
jgi:ABC-type dipeptide/oligopeptide/nickel transport system ATPase subunit